MHAATTNLSILSLSYHWAGLIGVNLKDTATKSIFSFVLKLREASNVSNISLTYITLSTIVQNMRVSFDLLISFHC